MIFSNDGIITLLRKGHTVNLTVFHFRRCEIGVGLKNNELSTLFLCKDGTCFICVSWCYDTIRNFLLQDESGCFINNITDSRKIAEGTHGISITCTEIGKCNRCKCISSLTCYLVGITFHVLEWNSNGCSSRRNVFEGRSSSKTGGFSQFFDKLPCIRSIQKVDVSRYTIEYIKWQTIIRVEKRGDHGRLLVWVATVFKGEFWFVNTCGDGCICFQLVGEPRRNSRIVGCGEGKGTRCKFLTKGKGSTSIFFHGGNNLIVLVGCSNNGGEGVVFGGGTKHRWTADVNVFNALFKCGSLCYGCLKGVEVQNCHVNFANTKSSHVLLVLFISSDCQQSTMDFRV
mmetsp:Transcript_19575/g.28354  ORF Transcript_19575/g.28354 Transcript_19575/m.28354 type:complete len:342 (-) Transcript_19575:318-1343(-)